MGIRDYTSRCLLCTAMSIIFTKYTQINKEVNRYKLYNLLQNTTDYKNKLKKLYINWVERVFHWYNNINNIINFNCFFLFLLLNTIQLSIIKYYQYGMYILVDKINFFFYL